MVIGARAPPTPGRDQAALSAAEHDDRCQTMAELAAAALRLSAAVAESTATTITRGRGGQGSPRRIAARPPDSLHIIISIAQLSIRRVASFLPPHPRPSSRSAAAAARPDLCSSAGGEPTNRRIGRDIAGKRGNGRIRWEPVPRRRSPGCNRQVCGADVSASR